MKRSGRAKTARRRSKTFGELLIESMQQAVAIERGELEPGAVHRYPLTARHASAAPAPKVGANDVRTIRDLLEVSQPVFAAVLNVSAETVKAWEQGKKRPSGPAARLLQIAKQHPNVLHSTLRPARVSEASTKVPGLGRPHRNNRLARAGGARSANRRGRSR